MKRILIYAVITAFVLFAGTNNNLSAQNKKNAKTDAKPAAGAMNEKTASSIIGATNTLIELYNNHLNVMRYVMKALDQAEENIATLQSNINRSAFTSNCVFYHFRDDKISEYENAFKKSVNFPEKSEIVAAFNYVRGNVPRLDVHCKALNEYFQNKNYKTDEGFANYKVLFDSLLNSYNDVSLAWRKAAELAGEAGDRAEIVILKKSPIAEFIIPLKTDLGGMRKLMKVFRADKVDYILAKTMSDSLALAFANNKRTDNKNVKKLTQYAGEENYKSVYRCFEDCIKHANQIIQLCDPERNPSKKPEQVQEDFDSHYKSMQNEYNSAIDIYNLFEN